MRFDAVIFDLDGTLLDTLDDLADSMNSALSKMGFPEHNRDEYKYFVGDGMKTLVPRALPEKARTPEIIEQCTVLMRAEYDVRWNNKTRPYPGVPELLDSLTAMGIKKAVLSNKPDKYTKLVVAKLLPDWMFESVYGADPPRIPVKPDPGGALVVAAELAVEPARILYLGDTNTDMRTANAAGFFALGAAWGFRTAKELEEAGARAVIGKPPEALGFIK
ncbi:MAG: HAD family hydrolase [Spirochaetes bacterium GWF1_51_8]|nr:MAG: HAD family hydrolase [Spirochaetes bacterium GWF1_51_8]